MSLLLMLVRSSMWYNPTRGHRAPTRWIERRHYSIQGLFTASWCRSGEWASKQHKSAWRIETIQAEMLLNEHVASKQHKSAWRIETAFCRDSSRSFDVARACVAGKLLNMRTLLLRYARSRDDGEALIDAAQTIRRCLRELTKLSPPTDTSDRMHGLGPLLGLEGSGSSAYYGVFGKLLKGEWSFPGRVKRPPTDPINALLSFGYTLLTNQVVSLINAVGLDPGLGVLHQPGFGKPALALDLVECFRPIIIDSIVVTMINTGQIGSEDFEAELGAYRLKDKPRRTFLEKFEARLSEVVQHPLFGYRVSYRRCIELQARIFAKHTQGEIERYVPFTVR